MDISSFLDSPRFPRPFDAERAGAGGHRGARAFRHRRSRGAAVVTVWRAALAENPLIAILRGLDPAIIQATLLELSAASIADAIGRHAANSARILVCGGGARNGSLMRRLQDRSGLPVESTASYGVDPDWMEAMAFAWLAQQTLSDLPGNLPGREPLTSAPPSWAE